MSHYAHGNTSTNKPIANRHQQTKTTQMFHSNLSKKTFSDDLKEFNSISTKSTVTNSLMDIPKEILREIFEYSHNSISDLVMLCSVTHSWRETFSADLYWKNYLFSRFPTASNVVKKNYMSVYTQAIIIENSSIDFSKLKDKYTILMLGEAGVGKTSLTTRFVRGTWTTMYDPTLDDCLVKEVHVGKPKKTLDLLDLNGSESFPALMPTYYHLSDGFMICFDLHDMATLFQAELIFDQVCQSINFVENHSNLPVLLVGTKSDLVQIMDSKVQKQIQKLCDEYNLLYVETSSLSDYNVDLAFNSLLGIIVGKKTISQDQWLLLQDGNEKKKVLNCTLM